MQDHCVCLVNYSRSVPPKGPLLGSVSEDLVIIDRSSWQRHFLKGFDSGEHVSQCRQFPKLLPRRIFIYFFFSIGNGEGTCLSIPGNLQWDLPVFVDVIHSPDFKQQSGRD